MQNMIPDQSSLALINWIVAPRLFGRSMVFVLGALLSLMFCLAPKIRLPLLVGFLAMNLIIIATEIAPWKLMSRDSLRANFCQLGDGSFCALGGLLDQSRQRIPIGARVAVFAKSGYEPYFYYYLADRYCLTRDLSRADYLIDYFDLNIYQLKKHE